MFLSFVLSQCYTTLLDINLNYLNCPNQSSLSLYSLYHRSNGPVHLIHWHLPYWKWVQHWSHFSPVICVILIIDHFFIKYLPKITYPSLWDIHRYSNIRWNMTINRRIIVVRFKSEDITLLKTPIITPKSCVASIASSKYFGLYLHYIGKFYIYYQPHSFI